MDTRMEFQEAQLERLLAAVGRADCQSHRKAGRGSSDSHQCDSAPVQVDGDSEGDPIPPRVVKKITRAPGLQFRMKSRP